MKSSYSSVLTNRRTLAPTIYTGNVLWSCPDNGLWVATSRDGYLGMVEEVGEAYRSTNSRGAELGSFADLTAAMTVIHPPMDEALDKRDLRSALVLTAVLAGAAALIGTTISVWITLV